MIRRALLSVSDKTGLVPFARALAARGVELLSTGGTHQALVTGGVPVTTVEAYTGSPEVMDGRVKTLHPRVHGGILMRGEVDDDDLARLGGKPIDLVVVNLYPFAETVAKSGGVARGRHREHRHRRPLHGPLRRQEPRPRHRPHRPRRLRRALLAEIEASGEVSLPTSAPFLAAKAFAHTAAYDGRVAAYLSSTEGGRQSPTWSAPVTPAT